MWCKTGELKNMRLIDIDNLKEQIDILTWYHINKNGELVEGAEDSDSALYKAEDIYRLIDNAPTVVNEYTKGFADGERSGRHFPLTEEEKAILVRQWQPKGEWIIKPKENSQSAILICNKCNHFIPITIDKNFCPNCGARMEVKKNE